MSESTHRDLEEAIALARGMRLRQGVAAAKIHQLKGLTESRKAPARRGWRWGLVAVVPLALGLAWWLGSRSTVSSLDRQGVVVRNYAQVGDYVGLVAGPGADYSIETSKTTTLIGVRRGTVTARLHKSTGHELILASPTVKAVAVGTVYSISVELDGQTSVLVHEGQVNVQAGAERVQVEAGQQWPGEAGVDQRALATAVALLMATDIHPPVLKLARPSTDEETPGKDQEEQTAEPAKVTPDPRPRRQDVDKAPIAAEASVDMWRRARLLRGQARYIEAMTVLDELAKRREHPWSPLAQAEAVRIAGTELSNPSAVKRRGQQFLRRYPAHSLRGEIERLVCRAHKQTDSGNSPGYCSVPQDEATAN